MNKLLLILLLSFSIQAAAAELEQPQVDIKRVDLKAKIVAYFQANPNVKCDSRDSAKQIVLTATSGKYGLTKLSTLQAVECHEFKDVFWEAYRVAHPPVAAKELTKVEQDAMELKAVQAIKAKNALVKKLVDYFKANPEIVCVSRDHAKQVIIGAVTGIAKLPALKDVNLNDLHALIDEPFNAYLESKPVVVEEVKE